MIKLPCVFPKDENRGMGDKVFFFEVAKENDDFVRVYEFEEDEKYTIMLHKSKIREIDRDMYEFKLGNFYLKDKFSQF
ncbi:hypothetical protein [Paenibacillus sp. LK1]|uniref:hypothetical protein n=1 Tax=Paenibacillus sp. LK1 TaxID=2053014 RepID=UPI000C185134|nr:hypothetical protein [Paenibacillus sp. LK1]PIH59124.1 hypothetical protein CS562_14390 [Paenibacillus sp. LK1]